MYAYTHTYTYVHINVLKMRSGKLLNFGHKDGGKGQVCPLIIYVFSGKSIGPLCLGTVTSSPLPPLPKPLHIFLYHNKSKARVQTGGQSLVLPGDRFCSNALISNKSCGKIRCGAGHTVGPHLHPSLCGAGRRAQRQGCEGDGQAWRWVL